MVYVSYNRRALAKMSGALICIASWPIGYLFDSIPVALVVIAIGACTYPAIVLTAPLRITNHAQITQNWLGMIVGVAVSVLIAFAAFIVAVVWK